MYSILIIFSHIVEEKFIFVTPNKTIDQLLWIIEGLTPNPFSLTKTGSKNGWPYTKTREVNIFENSMPPVA